MKELELLRNLIALRRIRAEAGAVDGPRIVVISSFDYTALRIEPETEPKLSIEWEARITGKEGYDRTFPDLILGNATQDLPRDLIRDFASLTASVRHETDGYVDVAVYLSDTTGAGKTHEVMELMVNHNHVLPEGPRVVGHYLDNTAEEIPHDFSAPLVHLDLLPDLFGNHFKIWHQLLLAITFGYYLKTDGHIVSFLDGVVDDAGIYRNRVLLMEVPVLNPGSLTGAENFPIALHPGNVPTRPVFLPTDEGGARSRFVKVDPRAGAGVGSKGFAILDPVVRALVEKLFENPVVTVAKASWYLIQSA
jgi:hypothetical protein